MCSIGSNISIRTRAARNAESQELPYSLNIALGHDSSGDIIGVNGDYAGPLNILQNFFEPGVTSDSGYDSGTVGIQ